MNIENEQDNLPNPDKDSSSMDLLEKFTRELRDLSSQIKNNPENIDDEILRTVEHIQTMADQILQHFENMKLELQKELDESLSPLLEEVMDNAIEETQKVKKILPVKKGKLPHEIFEGSWEEQIARWVRLYSDWKNQQQISRQLLITLAERVDQLIEKDLQFIEKYQQQSLSHLIQNPSALESLKSRIQYHIEEPIEKLKSLKSKPKNLSTEEMKKWKEQIQRKRSSFMESVMQKIESLIEEDAPFSFYLKDETKLSELINECHFLEKEIDYIFDLITKIPADNKNEQELIHAKLEELRSYIFELEEEAVNFPQVQSKLKDLLKKIDDF